MVSGYFLSQDGWRGTGQIFEADADPLRRRSSALSAPELVQRGLLPPGVAQKLLIDGTLYHLWYFPAVLLGVVIARGLARLGLPAALAAALLLYLIGLGGDSYYGLTAQLPALDALYGGLFRLCSYTRNGLFLAPLFLLLGARESGWAGGSPPWAPFSPWPVCPWRRSGSAPRAGPATTACIFSSP